jgi:hypothetical protein
LARPTVNGTEPKKAQIDAVLFKGSARPEVRPLCYDGRRGAFVLDVTRADRAVRRVTVVARAGEREGRRTISLV